MFPKEHHSHLQCVDCPAGGNGEEIATHFRVILCFRRVGSVLALAVCACPLIMSGQRLSFGVVGGSGLTDDFRTLRYTFLWEGNSYTDVSRSGPHSFVVGPMIEVRLLPLWSVEVNALHRTLKYEVTSDLPGRELCGPSAFCGAGVSTWEFPVLVKHRIPIGKLRPFVAMGPSFRTRSNPAGSEPSSYGITAAAGIEMNAGNFYFSPAVRYTRWAVEASRFRPTIPNQVEVLAGIGYKTDAEARRAFGNKVWLGLIGGVPLTNDFPPLLPGAPAYTGAATRSADFRFAAGLMAEVEVTPRLSIEVNGLYRRLHFEDGPEVVVTWEIPVLAKYTFGRAPIRPFVEAGPSFRPTGNLNDTDPAHYGFSAGAGAEARRGRLRFTPALRYTRWAEDSQPLSATLTKRDQVEMLFGLSF